MNVGLPGTGIGGLFYLLMAFSMPVRELVMTMNGNSTVPRWRRVGSQTGLAVTILGALWGAAWLVNRLFPLHLSSPLKTTHPQVSAALGVTPTLLSFITLGGLIMVIEALSLAAVFAKRR